MQVAREAWGELWPEAKPLMEAHQRELTGEPLEVDHELAQRLESAGGLVAIGARESGVLVGYLIFYLSPALERRGTLVATQGPWFVEVRWRNSSAGLRLFREAMRQAKECGATRLFSHFWSQSDPRLAKFFTSCGGLLTETVYSIPLGPAGPKSEAK